MYCGYSLSISLAGTRQQQKTPFGGRNREESSISFWFTPQSCQLMSSVVPALW
jgi:hypothetical protein